VQNIGIIGLGKWSAVLTNACMRSSKVRIISAYSRSQETRDKFTAKYQIPCVENVEDLLGNPEIHGIILTVPNELHFEYAKLCAQHGKHVYIEKPITNNLAEAFLLRDVCKRYGVKVFIGHVAKLLSGVQLISQEIKNGKLGDICMIEGRFSNERALTLTPDNWRWYQSKAPGGPLSQIAIHQFDVLRFLGGEICDLSAMSARKSPVGAEVEDQWLINMQFKNGALGSITSSWTAPGIFEIRVIGTKGLMQYRLDQTKWGEPELLYQNASLFFQKTGDSFVEAVAYTLPPDNMFQLELELFGEMISGIDQQYFDADYGIEILALVEASRESSLQNSVKVNLSNFLLSNQGKV
jgi:predicted dehydrogenase